MSFFVTTRRTWPTTVTATITTTETAVAENEVVTTTETIKEYPVTQAVEAQACFVTTTPKAQAYPVVQEAVETGVCPAPERMPEPTPAPEAGPIEPAEDEGVCVPHDDIPHDNGVVEDQSEDVWGGEQPTPAPGDFGDTLGFVAKAPVAEAGVFVTMAPVPGPEVQSGNFFPGPVPEPAPEPVFEEPVPGVLEEPVPGPVPEEAPEPPVEEPALPIEEPAPPAEEPVTPVEEPAPKEPAPLEGPDETVYVDVMTEVITARLSVEPLAWPIATLGGVVESFLTIASETAFSEADVFTEMDTVSSTSKTKMTSRARAPTPAATRDIDIPSDAPEPADLAVATAVVVFAAVVFAWNLA